MGSDLGRDGRLTIQGGKQALDVGYYSRLKAWEAAEALRLRDCDERGEAFVATARPAPDAGGGASVRAGAAHG